MHVARDCALVQVPALSNQVQVTPASPIWQPSIAGCFVLAFFMAWEGDAVFAQVRGCRVKG